MCTAATTVKILELTSARDDIERGMAKLRVAGYTEHNDVYKRMVCAHDLLSMDIRGLQAGRLPLAKVNVTQEKETA